MIDETSRTTLLNLFNLILVTMHRMLLGENKIYLSNPFHTFVNTKEKFSSVVLARVYNCLRRNRALYDFQLRLESKLYRVMENPDCILNAKTKA